VTELELEGKWSSVEGLKLLDSRLTRRMNRLPAAVLSVPSVQNLENLLWDDGGLGIGGRVDEERRSTDSG
jgi:hypothetical protein